MSCVGRQRVVATSGSDGAVGLALLLAMLDLARIDARVQQTLRSFYSCFRRGRVFLRHGSKDRVETLLGAGHVFGMRDDEQVVVHHAVEHTLAALERIHSRARTRRLRIAALRALSSTI